MLRKGWMSKAALVAALAVAPNVADAAMFMTGDFPFGSVQVGPEAVEGTFNARIVLVNTTGAELPEGSTLTVDLPEGFTLTGLSGGGTGSILRGLARPGYGGAVIASLTNSLGSNGVLGRIAIESDATCGVYAIDVDPSTGLVWMLVGRDSSYGGCYRTSNRWLVRWDPNGAMFRWISGQYGANGMMFTSDGTLIVIGGNSMSRGAVYTVDKSTGSRTYRTRPRSSYTTPYAYNPNDGFLYGTDYCNVGIRINTANWASWTNSETSCTRRRAMTYERGNVFLFMNESEWRRWTVNPSDQSTVSNSYVVSGAPSQIHGLWSAGLDVATDGVTCDGSACTMIALPAKTHAVVEIVGSYSLPANLPPSNIVGQLVWRDEGGNDVDGSDIGLRIIAPDLAVSIVASATNVNVNDQFDYDVEVSALGGVDVNGAEVDVALPANVRLVSVSSSAGDCGMARTGARCVNLDVAADDIETITVTVEATADGLAAATVSIVEPTGDPVPSNDQDTASVVVGDTIDLAVSGGFAAAAAAPGDVALGAATPVTFTVVNRGPSVVTSTATVPLAGFELESVSTDVGTCVEDTDANVVRCTFGDFALHSTATVSMSVKPTSFGRPKLTMTASSALVDHTPGNDSYSLKFNVAAPSLSVALSDALGSSDGGRKVVAHLVASFETSTGQGASLREVTGTASFLRKGVAASGALVAYRDANGDGNIGAGDGTLGSARVTAVDGVFRLVFDAPLAVTGGGDTHILFVAEPADAQVAALDAGRDAEASMLLGLAPFAMAGLLALRRRRAIWAIALVAGLGGLAGCGSEDELDDLSSAATVQVTVEGVRATIEGDVGVALDIDGLPLSTGRVATGH